jgi:hypothetical protein
MKRSRHKRPLLGFWLRWQRARYRELFVEEGLSEIAQEVSKAEARARRRLAPIIGKSAALDAVLDWREDRTFKLLLRLASHFQPTAEQEVKLEKLGFRFAITI